MTLPAGVSYAEAARDLAVTQRGHWAPPYTSCMLAAQAMILEKVGYTLPLRRGEDDYAGTGVENFVLAQHRATGRPLSSGTTLTDSQFARAVLWANEAAKPPVSDGLLGKGAVVDLLGQGATIRVTGGPLSAFPRAWRLPAGYGDSRHAFCLNGTRIGSATGRRQVRLVDVMLRPSTGYSGQWVSWDRLYRLIDKSGDGRVLATWGMPGAALPAGPSPEPEPEPPEGSDMPEIIEYLPGHVATIDDDANVREAPATSGRVIRETTAPEVWAVVGWVRGTAVSGSARWLARFADGAWEYTHSSNVPGPLRAPVASSAVLAALDHIEAGTRLLEEELKP